jgi:hypothetical protein
VLSKFIILFILESMYEENETVSDDLASPTEDDDSDFTEAGRKKHSSRPFKSRQIDGTVYNFGPSKQVCISWRVSFRLSRTA